MGDLVWYGVWGYEYVCGGSVEVLRNFFLNLFFSFSSLSWNHFLFLCVILMFASQIFFLRFLHFLQSHFPPVICSISFSCKYLSCFQPLRAWPKGGGTVTNCNTCVTCHTCHTSVTDFRPKSGNLVEVTCVTSPKLYIVSHAKLRELTSLSFNINYDTPLLSFIV